MSDFDVQAVRVMVGDHRAIHGPSPVLDALAAACDEIERLNEVDARNDLFADCLHRALKIWKGDNPGADHWPDGAWTIAWILRNNEQLRADNARLTENCAALDKTASMLYQEALRNSDTIARLTVERDAAISTLEIYADKRNWYALPGQMYATNFAARDDDWLNEHVGELALSALRQVGGTISDVKTHDHVFSPEEIARHARGEGSGEG